jgi:hypothetical protein
MHTRKCAAEHGLCGRKSQIGRLVIFAPSAFLLLSGLHSATAQVTPLPGPCGAQKFGTIACLVLNTVDRGLKESVPGFQTPPGVGVGSGDALFVTPLTASQPVPSPASGFIYTFDSSAGVYVRSSQSFGPILSERADTVGRKKLFIGTTFQRFVFDKLDGLDLHALPGGGQFPGLQFLETVNVNLQLNQFNIFATYGLTDRLDVSLAVPISTVHYGVAVQGQVFVSSQAPAAPIPFFVSGSHTASGLGDVNLQVKGTVLRKEIGAVAIGSAFRFPTGDEYEALGAGALGVKPFVAGSITYHRVSPHVDIAYQLNGKSILSGDPITGEKRHIPDQILYTEGIDYGMARWFTVAFDVLGTEVIHGDRYGFRQSYNMTNGSAGFKINPTGKLLIVCNLLFRLNDAGLRTKIAPLVGLSYAF